MTFQDLEIKRQIWTELSDFYLDTILSEEELMKKAEMFSSFGCSLAQIKEINYREVAPLLLSNLSDAAGNWSGFNEEWLHNTLELMARTPKERLSILEQIDLFIDKLRVDYYTKRYFKSLERYMDKQL